MASATPTSTAATAKVTCIPVAIASALAVLMSRTEDASANTAPMTDAPVISPMLRDSASRPEMTPRSSGRTWLITAVLLAAWNSW